MKILQAETTQNQISQQDLRLLGKNQLKISKNVFNKGKKLVKKDKKILNFQKKEHSNGSKDKKQSQERFQCPKNLIKANYEENIVQKGQLFISQSQLPNLPSIYEKVSQSFFEGVVTYSQNQIIKSKSVKKAKQKMSNLDASCSVKNFLTKLKDQFQLKVLNLLDISQKLFFKHSKLQETQKYQKEAESFLSSDIFYKQSQNHRCKLRMLEQQFTIFLRSIYNSKSVLVQIENNPQKCIASLKGDIKKISLIQGEFIKELHNFQHLWENQISSKINQAQDPKNIARILVVLLKCYKSNNQKIQKMLQQVQKKQQISFDQEDAQLKGSFFSSNEQFYTKCLIKKCLMKTFSQEQTHLKSQKQMWNFFKKSAHYEQSIINEGYYNQDSFVPIETQEQYREYIKRITNRKILVKTILHTSCKACFSSQYQKSNPIIKCPECKFRIHKSCGKVQDRCDRCNYKKIGTLLKQNTKKCFICLNETSSLMLYKMKGNKFAHNFCLMVHNLWNVENNRLALDFQKYSLLISKNKKLQNKKDLTVSKMIDQNDQEVMDRKNNADKTYSNERTCKFCTKGSQIQKEFLRKCSNCNESCHILCAYLNGCKVQITEWQKNFQINLKVTCCSDSSTNLLQFEQKRKRLGMSRKYKINYENFATNLEKQKNKQIANFTQNLQNPERKLTKANIQMEIDYILPSGNFQSENMQELLNMNV